MEHVAGALPELPRLQQLNLFQNRIGPVGCAPLASALSHLTSLTSLNLFGTQVAESCCLFRRLS
jgi:hypothetical protein